MLLAARQGLDTIAVNKNKYSTNFNNLGSLLVRFSPVCGFFPSFLPPFFPFLSFLFLSFPFPPSLLLPSLVLRPQKQGNKTRQNKTKQDKYISFCCSPFPVCLSQCFYSDMVHPFYIIRRQKGPPTGAGSNSGIFLQANFAS